MTAVTTVTIIGGTGFQWGVSMDETGINIESFKSSVKPQFTETLPNKSNITRAVAYGPLELTVTLSGEINGGTTGTTYSGVMAAVIGTAFVPVNTTVYFNGPATGLYFEGGEITEMRNGWKKLDSATFVARVLIT